MKIYLLAIIFCFAFTQTEINTIWGNCTIVNNGKSFSDDEIKKIILNKINKLQNLFDGINSYNSFSVIIDQNEYKTNNPHWKWALGITYHKPERIIIKDPSSSHISTKKFKMVMEHELNHIMVNRLKHSHTIPRWFKEGFALFYSGEISLNHKLEIANNIHKKEEFNLTKIETFNGFNRSRFHLAYAQSAVLALAINRLYGDDCLYAIYTNMLNGMTFEKAFYSSTSKSINQFNNIAYPYLKNKYKWFKLITLPNQLFAFFPLLLILGFVMRSIKNKKIKEKWALEEELEKIEYIQDEDDEYYN